MDRRCRPRVPARLVRGRRRRRPLSRRSGRTTVTAEKAAFEAFVDEVIGRLDRDPGMHVYHYAAYEKTALRRLMTRYATREDEIDRILRAGVLVDLYQVVRQGLRASVDSYSIKRIETLLPGPARGPDHPGRVQRRRVRALARRPRPAAPGRPGRLQPRRLRVDPRPARLARGASVRGASARFHVDVRSPADRDGPAERGPGRRVRGDARRGSPRLTEGATVDPAATLRRRRPGGGSLPRSSTGTGATTARPGGTTSACASCRSTTSSASRSRSAASPSTGSSARRSSRTSCG